MRGALAEYERAKTLERTKRGLLGSAKAGHVNGGRAPLGYRYVSAPHQGRLAIDEAEAQVIRQIFQCYVEGLTIRAVARRLTEARTPTAIDRRGFTARAGRKPCKEAWGVWSAVSVAVILKNPLYMGQMRYNARANIRRNGRLVAHRWRPAEEWLTVQVPAIIDPETFATVQQRLQENREHPPPRPSTALLRGRWFRCGRCGLAMAMMTSHGRRYYRCSSSQTKLSREARCLGMIRADILESQVWDAVMRLLEQPELVADAVAKQQATVHEQEAGIDSAARRGVYDRRLHRGRAEGLSGRRGRQAPECGGAPAGAARPTRGAAADDRPDSGAGQLLRQGAAAAANVRPGGKAAGL